MGILGNVLRARRQRRNFQLLRELDDRLLRDIGLERHALSGPSVGRNIGRL